MTDYTKSAHFVSAIITERETNHLPIIYLDKDDLTDSMRFASEQYLKDNEGIIVIDLGNSASRFARVSNEGVLEGDWPVLNRYGWNKFNESGDYVDIEAESAYEKDDTGYRKSFNLHMSVNLQEGKISFSFGNNLGDGFNDYVWVNEIKKGQDLKAMIVAQVKERAATAVKGSCEDDFFQKLAYESEAYSDILASASLITTWLAEKG